MPESTPPGGDTDPDPGLARMNALTTKDLRIELAQCLDIDRWVEALVSEAPFPDRETLLARADTHARTVTGEEVASALARHPRIGENTKGQTTEDSWSREEQSAASGNGDAAGGVQRIFAFAQEEYEHRFGQIYLVCASGRGLRNLLADLVERLENDRDTELAVVGDELRKIAGLRLVKLLESV